MLFDIKSFMEDQKVDTYTFPLHRSSYGMKEPRRVTCKVIDIFEKASLGHLPEKLQEEFFKNVETVQDEIKRQKRNGKAGDSLLDTLAEHDLLLKQADKYCAAGWLDPKVVEDHAREDIANGVMWVGRVQKQDRIAYMIGCMDSDGDQAKHFEIFRDGTDDEAVPDRETVSAPQDPAVFPVQNAGERV